MRSTERQREVWRRRARAQYKRTNGLYQKRAHSKNYKRHPKGETCLTGNAAADLINNLKLQHGRCVLHPFYNDGQEYVCTVERLRAFCWDHIDRTQKFATISQMSGSATRQQIIDEIAKCQLVCANCHQIKSHQNKDHLPITRTKPACNQLALFELVSSEN
jgi:hypothetical protein